MSSETTHLIELVPSSWHPGMLAWCCSCQAPTDRSYGDVGGATFAATRHVPAGQPWTVQPAATLLEQQKAQVGR